VSCFWSTPRDDKMLRAARALPIFGEGRVFLVKGFTPNAWIDPFLNELVNFPHGRFDDYVDSLTQAVLWFEPRVNRARVLSIY